MDCGVVLGVLVADCLFIKNGTCNQDEWTDMCFSRALEWSSRDQKPAPHAPGCIRKEVLKVQVSFSSILCKGVHHQEELKALISITASHCTNSTITLQEADKGEEASMLT